MGLEGQGRVQHRLHALGAVLAQPLLDAVGMGRGLLDDVPPLMRWKRSNK
jgi:hypothetical protein